MAELFAFLRAVGRYLGAMANHSAFGNMRDEQFQNSRLRIRQSPSFDIALASNLVEEIASMAWTQEQRLQLQAEVNSKVIVDAPTQGAPGSGGRRSLQDYQNMVHYFPEKLWLKILGENPQQALGPICQHLALLGLRLRSERTASRLTALLIQRHHLTMDQGQKHQCFLHVKATLKKELAPFQQDNVNPWVLVLPADPTQHVRGFLDRAFPASDPAVECQLSIPQIGFVQSTIRERWAPSSQILGFQQQQNALTLTPLVGTQDFFRSPTPPQGLLTNLVVNHTAVANRRQLNSDPGSMLALQDAQPQLTHPEAAKKEEAKPVQTPAMNMPENTQPVLPLPDISKPASQAPQNESQPCDQEPEKSLGQVDAIASQLREKMDEKNQGKQTGMKRPSSCVVLKKPAAKTSKKPVAKKALKKPAASQKTNNVKSEKPPNALKMYPKGCPKCRWKPGCTPSCFKYRGEWWFLNFRGCCKRASSVGDLSVWWIVWKVLGRYTDGTWRDEDLKKALPSLAAERTLWFVLALLEVLLFFLASFRLSGCEILYQSISDHLSCVDLAQKTRQNQILVIYPSIKRQTQSQEWRIHLNHLWRKISKRTTSRILQLKKVFAPWARKGMPHRSAYPVAKPKNWRRYQTVRWNKLLKWRPRWLEPLGLMERKLKKNTSKMPPHRPVPNTEPGLWNSWR